MAKQMQIDIETMTPTENVWRQVYTDLEGDIGDLVAMAKIAAEKVIAGDDERFFTATHLCEMIEAFQQRWRDGHAQARGD